MRCIRIALAIVPSVFVASCGGTLAPGMFEPCSGQCDAGSTRGSDASGSAGRPPLCPGGDPCALYDGDFGQAGAGRIAVDANHVYWADYLGSSVHAVPINGGTDRERGSSSVPAQAFAPKVVVGCDAHARLQVEAFVVHRFTGRPRSLVMRRVCGVFLLDMRQGARCASLHRCRRAGAHGRGELGPREEVEMTRPDYPRLRQNASSAP